MGNVHKCHQTQKNPPRKCKSIEVPVTKCKYCTHSFSKKQLDNHEIQCFQNPLNAQVSRNYSLMKQSLTECESSIGRRRTTSFSHVSEETYTHCEFCLKAVRERGYKNHTKRCRKNPLNIRIPCTFCNEELASDLLMKHTVFCSRNPENIRVNCNGCNSRVKLRRYRDHLKECKTVTNKVISHRADECAICLCEITKNEVPKSLPCHHIFHDRCIADWSKKQNICPLCRAKIH